MTTVFSTCLDNAAATNYSGFDFDSACELDGVLYGIKADGIYALNADDDAGADIAASFDLGDLDFGTERVKLLVAAYLRGAVVGEAEVRITNREDTYSYMTRSPDGTLETRRVDVGRGLRENRFPVSIHSVDGASFRIEAARFVGAESKRRI